MRKIFLILGGILSLVAIFFLTFDGVSPFYIYGLAIFLNVVNIFTTGL